MIRALTAAILSISALAGETLYELRGRVEPGGRVSVSIFGSTTPFSDDTISDDQGRFRFRKLLPGPYTLAIDSPGRGEARVTVDVGPKSAKGSRVVEIALHLNDSDFNYADVERQHHAVSAKQLTIPDRARREYESARKDLERRDAAGAKAHLEKAVAIAPQFAAAWNELGTIAYHDQDYERAEECFRAGLEADPSAYEPLVNLGGVLINLGKWDEARQFNERAVGVRPNDALANAQLGIVYFQLVRLDDAEKYLRRAVEIDPAHFSHPQLVLAKLHLQENKPARAADDLENFLAHHPDWPQAAQLRATIEKLRAK